jgi:thiamine-monophosphate kinase
MYLTLPLPERALISRIAQLSSRPLGRAQRSPKSGGINRFAVVSHKLLSKIGNTSLITGIGDDCAVLRPPNGDLLVTTDFSLEGVHFRRDWHSPESVGHRCLARGLSDIAAMGGAPMAAFLSLGIPPNLSQSWVDRFLRGFLKLARQFAVTLAGGDTAESPQGVLADIIVLGWVPKRTAILRSAARPGDRIYVTGTLGGSAATLKLLYSKRKKIDPKKFLSHFFPQPRITQGQTLRSKNIPTSMIDMSDGLSTDLNHICEQSGVGAEIWSQAIPRAQVGSPSKAVSVNLALHGGEDYELLFTAPPLRRVFSHLSGIPVTCIGEITRHKQIFLVDEDGSRTVLKPRGWEHFRSSSDK